MYKFIIILLTVFILFSCKKKEGCTDPLAENYDTEAYKDNGTCTYTPFAEKIAGTYQFKDTLLEYLENGTLILRQVSNYQLGIWLENDSMVYISALNYCSAPAHFFVKKDSIYLYNIEALCCDCKTVNLQSLSFDNDTFRISYRKEYNIPPNIPIFYDIIKIKAYKI